MKDEVEKIDINKLVNFPTSLNNLETKKDNLDVGKLNFVPVDLKKLNDIVANKVVKYTKFNIIKTKVNSVENKVLYATTFHNTFHIIISYNSNSYKSIRHRKTKFREKNRRC